MTDRHQAPSYPLRMPADLKEKMVAAAKKSGRSLHAEILNRLGESFDEDFVTVIEASAKPGPESKRFEFNADEIADKVIERLEKRGGSKVKAQRPLNTSQLASGIEGPLGSIQESYLEYVRQVLEGHTNKSQELQPKPPANKGPIKHTRGKPPK